MLVLAGIGPDLASSHPWAFTVVVLVSIGKRGRGLLGLLGGEAHRFEETLEELRGGLEPDGVEAIARTVGE